MKPTDINLDLFLALGPPDRQNAPVMAECAGCSGEIYPGEEVYVIYGEILHSEWECLMEYIGVRIMTIEEALGVEA